MTNLNYFISLISTVTGNCLECLLKTFYSINEHKMWEFAFDLSILNVNEVACCRAKGSDEYGCGAAGLC